MTITRRQALILTAAPLFAQSSPKLAITMDDAHWQLIPEDRRTAAESRLLEDLSRARRSQLRNTACQSLVVSQLA
jgi:hypothetical protein